MLSRRVVILLLLPAQLIAQSTPHRLSLLAGFGFQNGEDNYGPGLHFGGRIIPYRASRLELRFELDYATFGQMGTQVSAPVPGPCPAPGCPSATGDRIKVLGTNADLALLRSSGFSWSMGIGLYHYFETPHDGPYSVAGWNVGFTTPMRRSFYFDMRYHILVNPRTMLSALLLSLGIGL